MALSTPLFLGLFPIAITGKSESFEVLQGFVCCWSALSLVPLCCVTSESGFRFSPVSVCLSEILNLTAQKRQPTLLLSGWHAGREAVLGSWVHTLVDMQTSFASQLQPHRRKIRLGGCQHLHFTKNEVFFCQIWCFQSSYKTLVQNEHLSRWNTAH